MLVLIGALIIGADSLYAVATTEGLLSVVVVLSSLYPVVTIVLARVYLHERLQRLQQVASRRPSAERWRSPPHRARLIGIGLERVDEEDK